MKVAQSAYFCLAWENNDGLLLLVLGKIQVHSGIHLTLIFEPTTALHLAKLHSN